jgi:hypothetical protein
MLCKAAIFDFSRVQDIRVDTINVPELRDHEVCVLKRGPERRGEEIARLLTYEECFCKSDDNMIPTTDPGSSKGRSAQSGRLQHHRNPSIALVLQGGALIHPDLRDISRYACRLLIITLTRFLAYRAKS